MNIGKVAGSVVRQHITFVLFLAWIVVSNYASGGATIAAALITFAHANPRASAARVELAIERNGC
jgi:hypothetical protein